MREPVLSVELVRTGGYVGRSVRARVSTENLAPAAAAGLRRLVAAVLALPPTAKRPGPPIPDAMHYRLDIVTDGQRRTVEVSDPDVPAEVRALITRLLAAGR